MTAFSTYGYLGENSPNRADAWFWVLAELFPGLVKPAKTEEKKAKPMGMPVAHGWMG
jgi:hypothetical protein